MPEPSPANLQLAIVLPLGVVANQLMRIEADLRFLNMKAFGYAKRSDNGDIGSHITARLDQINASLDLIRGVICDIEADMRSSDKRIPERDD